MFLEVVWSRALEVVWPKLIFINPTAANFIGQGNKIKCKKHIHG